MTTEQFGKLDTMNLPSNEDMSSWDDNISIVSTFSSSASSSSSNTSNTSSSSSPSSPSSNDTVKSELQLAVSINPSSSAIVSSNNNSISTTVLLGCSDIATDRNNNLVIAAMKSQESDGVFTGFEEAFITRNLYALSHVHAGPIMKEQHEDIVLSAHGDVVINGTLFAKHIADEELFLEGNNANIASTYNLLPNSGYNIVYANSVNGPVNIMLGTPTNNKFERNRRIVFKDTSLENGHGSMYNVNIIVPYRASMTDAPRIEYYNSTGLTVGCNAGYAINSSGGSVVLRYYVPISGTAATWVIESQFIGNHRSSAYIKPWRESNSSENSKR